MAKTAAKTEDEAATNMLDAIDLLRGMWNLHMNHSMVIRFGGGRCSPINKILTGALHTLHNDDGTMVKSGIYWYDSDYCKANQIIDISKKFDSTHKYTKLIRSSLKTSKYKKDIETLIIRYARAIDSQDYNSSFIKLWSVLEHLTATLHDSYDKTIKRTAFHFNERKFHRQVLEHLRQFRNKSVHTGSEKSNINTHVYQLKRYVEHLLLFHIANHFKFNNLSEAGEFMNLTPNIDLLKKQVLTLESGIKYLGGKPH